MRQEDDDLTTSEILKSEIEAAHKETKNQKSLGSDKTSKDTLIAFKEIGIDTICSLVNKIYDWCYSKTNEGVHFYPNT